MSTVSEHYANHLAPVYAWMAGGVDAAFARGKAEIDQICVADKPGLTAVDLGAGFGMHAIPLGQRGYTVTAIDSSKTLLDVLRDHIGDLSIRTVNDDLLKVSDHVDGHVDLILCMGDTLTHLPDLPSVEQLFESARRMLCPDGRLILTFRDYSRSLKAEQRFIPVRSDKSRVLTCFLEYSTSHVMVHDILHEQRGSSWDLSVSTYQKLRLSPDSLSKALASRDFAVHIEPGASGMVRVIATRT